MCGIATHAVGSFLLWHSLSKTHYRCFFCTAPIQWQPSIPYITVKRRKRPIADIAAQSMFDGIEMDVVCATLQIRFVAHGVFVKTSLPNTAFVPPLFAGGQVLSTRETCGEFGFNQPPTQGIIHIVGRQRPNGVDIGSAVRIRRRFQRDIVFAHPYKPRAKPICSASRRDFGSASLTVKKNVPPAMKFLR